MYSPSCAQQQISDEMRFCSRCGLALSGLAEWLAGGGLPAPRNVEVQTSDAFPSRKGIKRAAKLMFFKGVLFPIFLAISLAVDEGGPMIIPILGFFLPPVLLLYRRLFRTKTTPVTAQTTVSGSAPTRSSLPPPTSI